MLSVDADLPNSWLVCMVRWWVGVSSKWEVLAVEKARQVNKLKKTNFGSFIRIFL
jgi:hypothetical protein